MNNCLKILIFLAFTLIACKKDEKEVAEKNQSKTPKTEAKTEKKSENNDLKLETFGFPQEVDGCSCYFAENREEFVKQNYVYVDDYQRNIFIKINGKQVKIPFDKKKEINIEKQLNLNAENEDYKVTLKGTMVEEGEIETALYKGKLTVENKKGKKIEVPVYGECGC